MIFYLIYYLFLTVSLISLPYLVSNYILAGDPYLLVNTGWYMYFWLMGVIFIVTYAFSTTNYLYYCFFSKIFSSTPSTTTQGVQTSGIFDWLRGFHGATVAGVYSSFYMTIFAFLGYLVGITVMETVPQVKNLLLSVIHIPGFEFFLKGVPLALGGLIGNIFGTLCISPQC